MNGARTKLLITLGKIVIFYLSVAPWSRPKFYKLRVQKEKPAVFASHPHTVGPARRSSRNACGVAFSLTSGTAVKETDYRQTPTSLGGRRLRREKRGGRRDRPPAAHGLQEIYGDNVRWAMLEPGPLPEPALTALAPQDASCPLHA